MPWKEPTPGGTSLVGVPTGSRCRLVGISAGRGLALHLTAMGLVPGAEVKILDNQSGPVILDVDGARLSLGRGAAEKVLVEVLA